MSSKIRLSKFFGLKYKDRVDLLFEWFGVDDKERRYVLKDYNSNYERVYKHYFHFHGIITNAISDYLVKNGFVIDDTVDVITRWAKDKNGGHRHVIFTERELQKYKNSNEHISSSLTTTDNKEYPSAKLDFDPFLENEPSRISDLPYRLKKREYSPREITGKISKKDYYDKLKQVKDFFKK